MAYLVTISFLYTSCNSQLSQEEARNLCHKYKIEELKYFSEIAFGSEFGRGANNRNSRWTSDIRIKLFGEFPYSQDSTILREVVSTLNDIIEPINISLTKSDDYNLRIDFMSMAELDSFTFHHKTPFSLVGAQFQVKQHFGVINSARIILLNETIEQSRSRFLWEEITQTLGLMQDRPTYPKSIFNDCSNYTCYKVKKPLPIDLKLVDILYNNNLPLNMTREGFLSKINSCD